MTLRTLGTAGHVDHGKTALVRALTGTDTDRLEEERRRGISIELGYALLDLGDGLELSVVDVPGHERFVRTMVAGATGIDLALLCIACDDGVMPQTREHLAILELLGVRHGVVALTKRDLVDDDGAALAREDAADALAGSGLAGADVVEVSARTGLGLDELRAALRRAAGAGRAAAVTGRTRMPIDRVFSLRGIGTVVTGTLWGGSIAVGDRVTLLPQGVEGRVRSLQTHDRDVAEAHDGGRVAACLVGRRADGDRTAARCWSTGRHRRAHTASMSRLAPVPGAPVLRDGELVEVLHGTASTHARVVPLGEGGLAQLRLRAAARDAPRRPHRAADAGAADDHRRRRRRRSAAGQARRRARRGRARLRTLLDGDAGAVLETAIAAAPARVDDVVAAGCSSRPRRLRRPPTLVGAGRLVAARRRLADDGGRLPGDGRGGPPAADGAGRRRAARAWACRCRRWWAAARTRAPSSAAWSGTAWCERRARRRWRPARPPRAPARPATPRRCSTRSPPSRDSTRRSTRPGSSRAPAGRWWRCSSPRAAWCGCRTGSRSRRAAYDEARRIVVEGCRANGRFTLAELRDATGTSRRYAQAMLERLDADGVTRRVEDYRVLRRRGAADG